MTFGSRGLIRRFVAFNELRKEKRVHRELVLLYKGNRTAVDAMIVSMICDSRVIIEEKSLVPTMGPLIPLYSSVSKDFLESEVRYPLDYRSSTDRFTILKDVKRYEK